MELTAKERITRARIDLQLKAPFFGYLVLHLNLIEIEGLETCAIDKNANLYYDPDFINALYEEEILGVLAHEIWHVITEDFDRQNNRVQSLWNIATDIINNEMIISNGFDLPDIALMPRSHEIEIGGYKIENINEKIAEQIYDEIEQNIPKTSSNSWDIHIYQGGEERIADKIKSGEIALPSEIGKDWKQILSEATTYAKMKNNTPIGLDRYIDNILFPKLNWKQILRKYLISIIPMDMSYTFPSKASIVSECWGQSYYLPSVVDVEGVDVIVSIDTSGSISKEELTEFISELISLGKSFEAINIVVLICDTKIYEVYEFKNSNINKIKNIVIRGGGGTSHKPVYNWIKNNKPNAKLLLNFTDGFTEFPSQSNSLERKLETIWLLSENSISKDKIPFGKVIKM